MPTKPYCMGSLTVIEYLDDKEGLLHTLRLYVELGVGIRGAYMVC